MCSVTSLSLCRSLRTRCKLCAFESPSAFMASPPTSGNPPVAMPGAHLCPFASSSNSSKPSKCDRVGALAAQVAARLERRGKLAQLTLEEVAVHNHKDSGWIAVDGMVYDITHHVQTHKGWTCGCAVSTLMATLRCLGTECSEEFAQVHSQHARMQLQPYMIGRLVAAGGPGEGAAGCKRLQAAMQRGDSAMSLASNP